MSDVRIAMWSGPRNISTAMMRAFGNRADTVAVDEPLYSHYLTVTGLDHPAREEVIASQDPDWRHVTEWLTGPIPDGKSVWYQKHMTHHMIPAVGLDWLDGVTSAFLIRDPAQVVASYAKVRGEPTLEDLGFPQQVELFRRCTERSGSLPPVVDAADVRRDPRGILSQLCAAVGIPWDEAMLSWPPGPRPEDGVWAPHWYAAVERSTGFEPYAEREVDVPAQLHDLLERCQPYYDELAPHRLLPSTS